MWTTYLDWGLADFSGYSAADELYDGPFCVLSIVDNRTFKRLLYQVLDHDPEHLDITAFFHRFRMALRLRRRKLQGVTTDGSPLYPEPLREVFGNIPHQICEFHVIKELTKAILRAVAQVRKKLAAQKPLGKRGRPTTMAAKRIARRRQRLQQKIADLFEHRHLFVQHDLTRSERRTLRSITRGLPQLRTFTRPDGGSLPLVRSSLPHGHRLGEISQIASAGSPLQAGRQDPEQTSLAQPGQGFDVPRRQTFSLDLERGRTGQPTAPEDAKNGLPRSHTKPHPQPYRPGHAP
jgi:hypothetical protein